MNPRVFARRWLRLGLSLALLACLACGSDKRKLYPVRGKVLVDGKPAEGATVALYAADASQPMAQFPRGYVKADGTFTIGTYDPEDGAPAGDYKVVIVWMDEDPVLLPNGRFATKLPDKYSVAPTTPLSVQVKEGSNDLAPYELSNQKRSGPK